MKLPSHNFFFLRGVRVGQKWHHITISQLEEAGDSTSGQYKMNVRVNGKLLIEDESNDELANQNVTVYGSSPKWESLATAYQIDQHKIYNLRLITERKRK